MIVRKNGASARHLRFSTDGDTLDAAPEIMESLLYWLPPARSLPLSAAPVRCRRLAKIALLASRRVRDGLAWHNACYELTPHNAAAVLGLAKPDYLLVESCINDGARAWNHACFARSWPDILQRMAAAAARHQVPSIFWYTLGADMIDFFQEGMRAFDHVACADAAALERLRNRGIAARLLPWAFAPEQFNPLRNFHPQERKAGLLFDGIARMMRFPHVRDILRIFQAEDLDIIDTGMLVAPYNLERWPDEALKARVRGCVSRTMVQEFYKTAVACLSIPEADGTVAPGIQWKALEAAACRCPVLQCGAPGGDAGPLADCARYFGRAQDALDAYREFTANPIRREHAAQKAWRAAHSRHTFLHRMRVFHEWAGLDTSPFAAPLASVIVPSMRPENIAHVLEQYSRQTYAPKELVYVFNGARTQMPPLPHEARDMTFLSVPGEYTTGTVMNAGIGAASGAYVFKFDDDDLYGENYLADRMLYFGEFDLSALSNARTFMTHADSGEAFLWEAPCGDPDETVFCLGNTTYDMLKFTGGSMAMRRDYALRVAFQEQTYAYADVAILLKGIFLTPLAPYAKVNGLNLCVVRKDAACHTWRLSRGEMEQYVREKGVPVASVFI